MYNHIYIYIYIHILTEGSAVARRGRDALRAGVVGGAACLLLYNSIIISISIIIIL